MACSPDGAYAFVDVGGAVTMLHIETATVVRQFFASSGLIVAVAVSPRGDLLLTGQSDGRVTLWDVQSGRRVRILREGA